MKRIARYLPVILASLSTIPCFSALKQETTERTSTAKWENMIQTPSKTTMNCNDDLNTTETSKKEAEPLQHELPTLKRVQAQKISPFIKTNKGKGSSHVDIGGVDVHLNDSIKPKKGYQIAANREAAAKMLLLYPLAFQDTTHLAGIGALGTRFSMIPVKSSDSETE